MWNNPIPHEHDLAGDMTMWNSSIERAQLVSLGLTAFLYGIFFTLFVISTAMMTYNATESVRRQRKMILPVSFAMLLVATMHLVVVAIRAVLGFDTHQDGSAMTFYENLSHPTHLISMFCLCLQSVTGDCIMLWRMYIVYGKRILVVIPGVILIATYTVIACIIIGIMAPSRPDDMFHITPSWLTAYFSLTMATNIICTGAIAWRILTTGRALENARGLATIVLVMIESSALYTLGVVIALSTFMGGTNAQYPATDAIVPLAGIAFSLIVIQIRFRVNASTCQPSERPLRNDLLVAQTGTSLF